MKMMNKCFVLQDYATRFNRSGQLLDFVAIHEEPAFLIHVVHHSKMNNPKT